MFAVLAFLQIVACAPPPERAESTLRRDLSADQGYLDTIQRLSALNRKAAASLESGARDQAAALVKQGLPLSAELLQVNRPTLGAMEAVSDLDHLYGKLLLSKGYPVWARQMFVTNAVRWRQWKPESEDTLRRRREAEKAIAECDRLLKLDP